MAHLQGGDDIWPFAAPTNELKFCRLMDFSTFEVIKGISGAYVLVVYGKDEPRINPGLVTRQYPRQPDYWEIEVMGCLIGFIPPPELRHFPLTMGLDNTMGIKGIRLIGATKTEQWDLPKG